MTARRSFFRALVESHPELLLVLAPDGSVLYAPPATRARLGLGADPVDLAERIHPGDRDAFQATLDRLGEDGEGVTRLEVRLRHRDGWYLATDSLARTFSHGDVVEGVLVTARDETARRAALEALGASQRALQKVGEDQHQATRLEELGRLASSVAHDFNNLIHAIRANVELLSEHAPGREELDEIRSVCDRARALTGTLLGLGRKNPVHRRDLDVGAAVTELGRVLRRLMGGDIELRLDVQEGSHRVHMDHNQLDQVLLNLVVNARDAIQGTGTIHVRVGRPEGSPSSEVLLEVEDDGPGIPDAVLARIFEPFFSTKKSSGGTGIGLATVKQVVEDAGGGLEVETEVGRGTLFRIRLPAGAAGEAASDRPPAPRRAEMEGSARVLVVEDDPAIRRVVTRILERAGDEVVARSTWQGGEPLGSTPPDLILCDLRLQGEDGLEGAEVALADHPGIPVIFTSGEAAPPGLKARLPNPTSFLPKPFDTDELLAERSRLLTS